MFCQGLRVAFRRSSRGYDDQSERAPKMAPRISAAVTARDLVDAEVGDEVLAHLRWAATILTQPSGKPAAYPISTRR
jgi:hypothetical protein